MEIKRIAAGSLAILLLLAVLLTVQLAGPAASSPNRERSVEAWSDSLTRQAELYEATKAQAERGRTAWSERLSGLAQHQLAQRGMSERAKQAWSERLTAQAGE